MLGVRLAGPSKLFGDNKSMVTTVSIPTSVLKKKHNAIAYHPCREAVAMRVVDIIHCRSEQNLADMGSKALSGPAHQRLIDNHVYPPAWDKGECKDGKNWGVPAESYLACVKCESDPLTTNEVVIGEGMIGFLNHSRVVDDLLVELQDAGCFASSVEQMVKYDVDPDEQALEAGSHAKSYIDAIVRTETCSDVVIISLYDLRLRL